MANPVDKPNLERDLARVLELIDHVQVYLLIFLKY